MTPAELLAPLVRPLLFAAGGGAERLRGLRHIAEAVRRRANEAGLEPARLDAVVASALRFDEAAAAGRGAALAQVIAAVGALIPLPPALAAASAQGAAAANAGERSAASAQGAAAANAGERSAASAQGAAAANAGERSAASASGRRPRQAGLPLGPSDERAQPGAAATSQAPPAKASSPRGKGRRAADGQAERASSPARTERATGAPRGGRGPTAAAPGDDPILPGPAFTRGALSLPLTGVKGVGPKTAAELEKRKVTRVGHVLFYLPRGYQDRRRVTSIRELVAGQKGLTRGEVISAAETYNPRSRRKLLRVILGDGTGRLTLAFFHYWPSTKQRFATGRRFWVWGEVKVFGGAKQIVHPEVEDADADEADESLDRERIVPEYRGLDELGQSRYRALVRRVLDAHRSDVPEILPPALRRARELPTLADALEQLHFPTSDSDPAALAAAASAGHRRVIYEELLVLSVGLALKQRGVQVEPGFAFDTSAPRLDRALSALPFVPTGAQRRALAAIAADMASSAPMNRLIQGDVGSGKTAVAAVACLLAAFDGRQAAVMAPTELLAEQHFRAFSAIAGRAGFEVELLAAGRGGKALAEARRRVREGEVRIAVGTHALVEDGSVFPDLGLAVVDEQHRFGVHQRARLFGKGRRPDVLVMTATPIPRTLALVLHGELAHTVIDELPPGRQPIATKVHDAKDRDKVWAALEKQLGRGRQGYVVYPLIEESEHSDLEDATRGLEQLRQKLPGRRLELLHGRMKAEEKERVMSAFRAGAVDVLVATTVVEVGVDVPNATVMIVEHAERFGLSQLHQLRGRVGRGSEKSHCWLIAHGGRGEKARERLAVMEETTDGFRIAEADLEIRGPGEFLGTRQAGLPELTFADLSRDARLLEDARADAFALVAADPTLGRPEHEALRVEVFERFQDRMSLARVG